MSLCRFFPKKQLFLSYLVFFDKRLIEITVFYFRIENMLNIFYISYI